MRTFNHTKLSQSVGRWVVLSAAVTALIGRVSAIPIEGSPIIVAQDGHVIATFQGRSAGTLFSSDLYLDSAFPGVIFNNFSSTVGQTVDLGFFTAGTELVFRLDVNPPSWLSIYDRDYFSGDPTRNPDGKAHARVDDTWMPGQTLVEWEDLFGAPEGSLGFNDLFFSFSNVRSSPVPEGGSTIAFLALSLICIFGVSRRLSGAQG